MSADTIFWMLTGVLMLFALGLLVLLVEGRKRGMDEQPQPYSKTDTGERAYLD